MHQIVALHNKMKIFEAVLSIFILTCRASDPPKSWENYDYHEHYDDYIARANRLLMPKSLKCLPGWRPSPKGLCIFTSTTKETWKAAHASCKAMGAILAEPQDFEQMEFINSKPKRFWMGIKVNDKCKPYFTSNSRAFITERNMWYVWPIRCNVESCVCNNGGKLSNQKCSRILNFACQMPRNS